MKVVEGSSALMGAGATDPGSAAQAVGSAPAPPGGSAPAPGGPVLTVGNFDGLHVGHRSILATVIDRARALDGPAAVYTFEPHPRRVLHPVGAPRLLTTLEQKLELLEEAGIDLVIVEPFTQEFAALSPERFVREILHERIGPREVYVGYDFRYGRDREGSMRTLTEMGPHLGFSVTIIPEVTVDERDVNSTRIRLLLEEGAVEEAGDLLGRPYAIRGRVVEGDRRGRTIGFPTMNLAPENEILPSAGVYAGHLRFLDAGDPAPGRRLATVTNVGRRPTFKDADPLLAEAHVIDGEFAAYGRRVELCFEQRCVRSSASTAPRPCVRRSRPTSKRRASAWLRLESGRGRASEAPEVGLLPGRSAYLARNRHQRGGSRCVLPRHLLARAERGHRAGQLLGIAAPIGTRLPVEPLGACSALAPPGGRTSPSSTPGRSSAPRPSAS